MLRPFALTLALSFAVFLPAPGAAADDALDNLIAENQSARTATLREFMGERPGVLHLWATWCAPCRVELPELAATLEARKDLAAGITVLSVDRAPFERVRDFLEGDLGIALQTLRLTEGNVGAALGVRGYPATFHIAADGTIVERHIGVLDWHDETVRDEVAAFLSGD